MSSGKINSLRFIHGVFAVYFITCVLYIVFAAVTFRIDALLAVAIISLALEGLAVFVLNKGDCPLIYIQRKVGDSTPFFELFLPPKIAKQAIPFFTGLTWLALSLLLIRLFLEQG